MLRRTATVIALLLALTACGGEDSGKPASQEPSAQKSPSAGATKSPGKDKVKDKVKDKDGKGKGKAQGKSPQAKGTASGAELRTSGDNGLLCSPGAGPVLYHQTLSATGAVRITALRVAGKGVQLKHAWLAKKPEAGPTTGIADWPLRRDAFQAPTGWKDRRPAKGAPLAKGDYTLFLVMTTTMPASADRMMVNYAAKGAKVRQLVLGNTLQVKPKC